ncbi:hypothetical protein H6Y62_09870 [Staphylococcus lugdunensis]|jgi:uncharacterized protein YpmS|uniref:Uncharacterized protein n=1 Tax=Staphylococcus lugdunensis TaxID=28035 RepID=A0A133Q8I8_STALU|nr:MULTISPECIES: hypothetical protein [Staphylococcus]ADC88047.1 hypothetical protein SLGD_01959 [Staphylococcus lugdunensis HKU09-01]AMG61156.1 hypothetical protein AL499_04100 [Staphylococcus lugdunensis]AMG64943.1 hypothetical protein AL501_12025 [Staphylococcus lugdunensis]ARB78269.1 hypothetical protein A6J61_08105 [Staphylococcus lugdunensis]ARJ09790.1 hypothetical protein B7454_10430 [Staphylococcus lugdunensis]
MEETGKALKIWTWVFMVLSLVVFLFGIGSIICSYKYKQYNEEKGAKLLQTAIIVTVVTTTMTICKFFV